MDLNAREVGKLVSAISAHLTYVMLMTFLVFVVMAVSLGAITLALLDYLKLIG